MLELLLIIYFNMANNRMKPIKNLNALNQGQYFYSLTGQSQVVFCVLASDYISQIQISPALKINSSYGYPIVGQANLEALTDNLRLKELEKATRYFRYFTEKARTVFWVRDANYSQIYVSPGYEKIWGRSCESLYNNPECWIDTLVPEDQAPHTIEVRYQILKEQGRNVEYENNYRIRRPDGENRWIKDTSFPIYDEQDQFLGFAGIAEDVTEEVARENEMREAKQRAEVANLAKSEFLAMISHEIRTPLNAILGMTQILKTKGLSSELEEYLDIISGAGNGLLSLVSDILDFAKLEAGKLSISPEPFDLNSLVAQTVHGLQYQVREKGIEMKIAYSKHTPRAVIGDANRVRQVLINLLSNAIKFTEKGYIKVLVQCVSQINNSAIFEFSVVDTGIGIHPDNQDKIFEKFSQIDSIYHRKQRGIGLGLAITKELILAMGGQIRVVSELGKGSEFRFTLPLRLQFAFAVTNQEQEESCPINFISRFQYSLRVLLVEDNLINQKIAKVMLEDFGCQVDVMENGKDVFAKINTLHCYDIIFLDVGLPDMSGYDIAQRLRKEESLEGKPIVAMTAHILERDRQQAASAGMNRIVAKPITYDELDAVLGEYSSPVNKTVPVS